MNRRWHHSTSRLLKCYEGDRDELPLDFRFVDLLLRAAMDPERHLGPFAQGVKVGPGTRMPRLPALYRPKRRWRPSEQQDPRNSWMKRVKPNIPGDNCATVLEDQVTWHQVIKLTEAEAVEKFPGLVTPSLGRESQRQAKRCCNSSRTSRRNKHAGGQHSYPNQRPKEVSDRIRSEATDARKVSNEPANVRTHS